MEKIKKEKKLKLKLKFAEGKVLDALVGKKVLQQERVLDRD